MSSLESLLKQAEVALYRAKQDGRRRALLQPEMQAVVDAHATWKLHARGAGGGALQLFFQPQVNRRGVVIGAEARCAGRSMAAPWVSPAGVSRSPRTPATSSASACGAAHRLRPARWQMNERTRHLKIAVNVSAPVPPARLRRQA